MSFVNLLDNVCDIGSDTLVSDGQGGYTDSTAIKYSNVPCRFESKPRKLEIMAYGGSGVVYPDYTVYIESRSAVKKGDHIIFEGRTFEIKLIEDWSERSLYMSLHVVEIGR